MIEKLIVALTMGKQIKIKKKRKALAITASLSLLKARFHLILPLNCEKFIPFHKNKIKVILPT